MLIITVHYPQRELIPKLLLAHKAASRFGASIIGRTGAIRKKNGQVLYKKLGPFKMDYHIQAGVVLEMATTPESAPRLANFRSNGFNVASFCEEATAFPKPNEFAKRRIAANALEQLDLFFSWGKWHQEAINFASVDRKKIITIGHPRYEIYQSIYRKLFEDQIKEIQNNYGKFILINTTIDEMTMEEDGISKRMQQLHDKLDALGEKDFSIIGQTEEQLFERAAMKKRAFLKQISVANELLASQGQNGIKVVMRPKPSLSSIVLLEYAQGLGYLGDVDGRLSVTPWLYACSAMVHHGCTTGIESALLRKPAVMVKEKNDSIAKPVEDSSFCVSDADEAVCLINKTLKGMVSDIDIEKKYSSLFDWHANIEGSPSDSVLEELYSRGLLKMNTVDLNKIYKQPIESSYHRNEFLTEKWDLRGIDRAIDKHEVIQTVSLLNSIFGKTISIEQLENEVFLLRL